MARTVATILNRSRATAIEDGLGVIMLFSLLVGFLHLNLPL